MENPFILLIEQIIQLYIYVVIVEVVLSWLVVFNVVNSSNRLIYMIGDFTHRFTNPVLRRIRRYIPDIGGMDISPVLLLICLIFLQRLILWNAY